MKELYLKIIYTFLKDTKIREKFIAANLSPIKHINIYAGQDYQENKFDVLKYPAMFLSWSIDYTPKIPEGTLVVRLCWEQMRDIGSNNPNLGKDHSLDFLRFIDLVDIELKEIQTKSTSKLTLTKEELNVEDTIIDTHTSYYRFSYSAKSSNSIVKFDAGQITNLNPNGELFAKLS